MTEPIGTMHTVLCVNCENHKASTGKYLWMTEHTCLAPEQGMTTGSIDPVTGYTVEPSLITCSCKLRREAGNFFSSYQCGPEAKWFKPKVTIAVEDIETTNILPDPGNVERYYKPEQKPKKSIWKRLFGRL